MYDVIIIGGGPAGSTAAMYTSRAELKTLVLDKGVQSGALGITQKIANYPGVPGEVGGADLVEIMQKQAASFGAEFRKARVTGTSLEGDIRTVFTAEGETFEAKALIVATGAMGRSSVVPGEEELLGRGVSYCATCDGAFFRNRRVFVAGGTVESMEEALFLTRFASEVLVGIAKSDPPGDEDLVEEIRTNEKIRLMPGCRLKKIEGEKKVEAVVVSHAGREERIELDGVFIFGQGNKPISDFLQEKAMMTPGGCVLVNKLHETRMTGVFACGDVICNEVQQAVVAAAQGCIAALGVDKYINRRAKVSKDYK